MYNETYLENSRLKKKEKSIAKNVIFNIIYKIMNMIFPFVTSIYISHILMAEGVGKVSEAQNIVQYFVLLAPLGLLNYGTREIAKIKTSLKATNKLFTELFTINFCSTLCCVLTYYIMVCNFNFFQSEKILYIIAGLPIIFNFINIEWYYQGNEDYAYITLRSIIVKILSLIAIFIFVKDTNDYVYYALIYSLGIAGNYIFNISNVVKKGIRLDFSSVEFFRHFKPIFVLLCSTIAIELYTLLDTTMLGILCTNEIVGYYTNSIRLVKIVVSLIAAIGGVLLPRLTYYKENNMLNECNKLISKITQTMIFFAIPSGLGIFLLSKEIVWIMFGESFIPSILTVKIATILIYVLGFSNLFGTQVLLPFGQEKKLLICTCIGAISNVIMNAILIPVLQHNGAVISSVISETIVTCMTVYFALKYIKISISLKFLIKTVFAGIVMSLIIYTIGRYVNNDLICIIVSVIIGAISYIMMGILLKNPLVQDAQEAINKRFFNKCVK